MASGVKVADNVKDLIDEMRVHKKDDDPNKRIRILVLDIDGDIVVKEIYKEEDLCHKGGTYKFLQSLMKDGECKYIVYDCHYKTGETPKEEMVFIMWSSDNALTKMKMCYASSKGGIKKKITDVKHDLEFHGLDDITPEHFAECIEKVSKCKIQSLEEMDFCGCQQKRS